MDGETDGSQQEAQGAQDKAQQQGQGQQETQQQGQSQVGGETPDYEKQIAERDEKIASLEAQVVYVQIKVCQNCTKSEPGGWLTF